MSIGGGLTTEGQRGLGTEMLEARDLACRRGERVIFAGLSFGLDRGEALLLVGANGAGKSSLLRLLAGLLAPAEGQLLWDGEDALADRAAHAGRLRYLSHQDALKPALTARENLSFFARLWGGDAEAALAVLGLAPLAELAGPGALLRPEAKAGAGPAGPGAGAALAAGRADGGAGCRLGRTAGWVAGAAPGGRGDGAGGDPPPPAPARRAGAGAVSAWLALLARELRLALRHPADTLAAVLFFVLVAALFPFGIGPAPEALARLAPGALLAAALLAALLPLDRLFGADAEDGTLDQLLLSGIGPAAVALAKAVAHWLTTGLPLLVATPVAAAMLNLPTEAWLAAAAALGLATGFLSLLGPPGRR